MEVIKPHKSTLVATLTLLAAFALPAFAEKAHNWQTATVISQNLNSQAAGAYAAPIGAGVIGVPHRTNYVVVEDSQYRYQWSEIGAGQGAIVLIVNSQVQFYRDKNFFVVLDTNNHKHKFLLVGMTAK